MEKGKRIISSGKNEKKLNKMLELIVGGMLVAIFAWIFYDSVLGLCVGIVVFPVWRTEWRRHLQEQRRKELMHGLKEILLLLSSYLQSGLSIENSFCEVEREFVNMHIGCELLEQNLRQMNQKVRMNISVEKAFGELAEQIEIEEALEFAEILSCAKRLGGNYILNVQRTARRLEEKIEVEQEIAVMVAEKRLEFYVMCFMPMAMISYIKISSFDFINVLYHNMTGICVMTFCICFYLFMMKLGRRMISIET